MSQFTKYRRTQIAEMRPVNEIDIAYYQHYRMIQIPTQGSFLQVSISDVDKANGSPKLGDMIARNPKNHNDQWLVAKEYFETNFEEIPNVTK